MIRGYRITRILLLAVLTLGLLLVAGVPRDGGPTAAPQASAAGTLTWEYKNATLASWSENDLYDSAPALRQLADTGANSVTFVVSWYTSSQYSADIYRTGGTASDAALISAIGQARSLGLKVLLKPHLDSQDGNWRAFINPGNADQWFANYTALIDHYADLGNQQGAVALCIGAELISMSTNPAYEGRWRALIAGVRGRFPGKLTYSANWGGEGFAEEFPKIPFWDALDYLGISAYFELATTNTPTVASLNASWASWKANKIVPFQQRWNKPLLFTEIGYRSVDGAARQPWNWGLSGPLDTQEQVDLYEALFQSWGTVPWFSGAQFWFWNVDAGSSGTDSGYEVQNKPAYGTVTAWFGGRNGSTSPPPTPVPPTPTPTTPTALVLYDNALRNGFQDGSFGYSAASACDGATYVSAACSYAITYTPWGGINFVAPNGTFSTAPYARLEWALRPNGQPLGNFSALLTDGAGNVTAQIPLAAGNVTATLANGWVRVAVPLAQLNPANVPIGTVQLKNVTGNGLPQINVDDVRFVKP